jgi:hypothetical protein
MQAPPPLRIVLATRHDVRLGLHKLRLEGELTEVRERGPSRAAATWACSHPPQFATSRATGSGP